MTTWIDIAKTSALSNGERLTIHINGMDILVLNVDKQLYAIEDVCTHDGGDIAEGTVEQCQIVCPRHGARFCLKTGDVISPPAYEALRRFPLRVTNNMIQIDID